MQVSPHRKSSRRVITPSEADIKKTATEWLALDGWRFIDTDPPGLRGLGVREPGIADRLYIRYSPATRNFQTDLPKTAIDQIHAEVLWIEWKRKKGRTGTHQLMWIERERAQGALVLLAGVNFPASIDGFMEWYRKSGLGRKNGFK